jgi:heavy metal translocating P-type ATPase
VNKLIKRWNKFDYKEAALAAIALLAAIIAYLFKFNDVGNIILIASCVAQVVPMAKDMINSIREGELGVDLLAITAIVTSLILGEYITAGVIVLMLTGGESLENYAEHRAEGELDALMNRQPSRALILKNGKEIKIKLSEIKKGDIVILKAGDVVPVDAIITEGSSFVDESALTGESVPVEKSEGLSLISGSINMDGNLHAKATSTAEGSQYQKIVQLVKEATTSRARFVRLADQYSVFFTVISFTIAFAAFFISGGQWIRFLQVLVVATPCPLLLGAPIALVSGMSRAAKAGIIVKNGTALEVLAKIKTLALDKTGTITSGELKVGSIISAGKLKQSEILSLAAGLESGSHHIVAKAIVDLAKQKNIDYAKLKVKEVPGMGLVSEGKEKVLAGTLRLMEQNGIKLNKDMIQSSTAVYVAKNNELVGVITFTDSERAEAKSTIAKLKQGGIEKIVMITGDAKDVAKKIAATVGIKDYKAECLPEDKLAHVRELKSANLKVGFVGDGINDAPVLASADVGIALGAKGSAAASESADVVIMLDDFHKVYEAREIAKYTFKTAKEAILIGIGISIGLMLIFATGKFSPVVGAGIQELIDVIVMIYAYRAHRGPKSLNRISA